MKGIITGGGGKEVASCLQVNFQYLYVTNLDRKKSLRKQLWVEYLAEEYSGMQTGAARDRTLRL